jgi:hypothetical protein
MSKVTIWSQDTVPNSLIESLLNFYKKQQSYDHNFGGKDLRGLPPQYEDLPEVYNFLESLGYEFIDKTCTGNYLETASSYPIHADTGKADHHSLDYTIFLFPLYIPEDCNSYLFLLNQKWLGEATTFVQQQWPKGWNHMATDYNSSLLQNLNFGKWDTRLNLLGIPFIEKTLDGMTVDCIYSWKVGSMISFPCNQLHMSVTDSDIPKIGLSLRIKTK